MRSSTTSIMWMAFALNLFCAGCTSLHLQRTSNRQAKTLAQLYDQQVLDNLAAFVVNQEATPFFAVPADGSNTVSDSAGVTASDQAFTKRFWDFISASGGRTINQSWALKPVVEPNRLLLMKCAYQKAIGVVSNDCLDCCKIEKDWWGPDYNCCDPCGIQSGWLRCSTKWKDVPKCCDSYGHHCGTYVWVEPCHRKHFSTLVMYILNYACGDPYAEPKPKTKEVRIYLKEDGSPASNAEHYESVFATVESDKGLSEIEKELHLGHLKKTLSELEAATEDQVANVLQSKTFTHSVAPANRTDRATAILELKSQIMSIESRLVSPEPSRLPSRMSFGEKAQNRPSSGPLLTIPLRQSPR